MRKNLVRSNKRKVDSFPAFSGKNAIHPINAFCTFGIKEVLASK